ncbi:MAG: hypothetical protein H7X93_00615 [Sphingomonadaceae bacterium]|nr:hypothetical protein [Sphingomonadaceae bacterium]
MEDDKDDALWRENPPGAWRAARARDGRLDDAGGRAAARFRSFDIDCDNQMSFLFVKGWYQIRKALEVYSDTEITDFDAFKAAYAALSAKLRQMVFELGFLPE